MRHHFRNATTETNLCLFPHKLICKNILNHKLDNLFSLSPQIQWPLTKYEAENEQVKC